MFIKHLIAAATLALAGHASAVTVINGSFEADDYSGSGGFQTVYGGLTGWTVIGNVDVVSRFGGWGPQEGGGNQSLELNGVSAGGIAQNIGGFTVGQQYELSYFINNVSGGPKAMITFLGATTVRDGTVDVVIATNSGWLPRSILFTALDSTVGLSFRSLNGVPGLGGFPGDGPSGMAIDNISIAAVPEPHEWAMLLAGLGLVGFVARRKRSEALETTGAVA